MDSRVSRGLRRGPDAPWAGARIGAAKGRGEGAEAQMAEVVIPRQLFAEILRLIDGLRPNPAPT